MSRRTAVAICARFVRVPGPILIATGIAPSVSDQQGVDRPSVIPSRRRSQTGRHVSIR